jgi:hypothetical protein
MDISNLAASPSLQSLLAPPAAATSATPSQTSPAVQSAALLASTESALFSSLTNTSAGLPDLSGLTGAAQAYALYTNPALLAQLAGNGVPASAAASNATTANTGATFTPPAYSFNPFDETSWWTSPPASLGTTVDALA